MSVQVARFVRLPAGYYVTSSDNLVSILTASSLLKCSTHATIQELAAFNVTHYSFKESSEGSCKIYTSFDYIWNANASTSEDTLVWFFKVPDNLAYGGSCDKQVIKRLAKDLNTTRYVTSAPSATKRTTLGTTGRTTLGTTKRTTPTPMLDCVCTNDPSFKQQFWSGSASPTAEVSFQLTCKNMRTVCIVPEQGKPWEPVGTPPDALYLYPYCEKAHEHFTSSFYNKQTGLVSGWLGTELVQSDGGRINEARYYDPKSTTANPNHPYTMKLRPRGFTSEVYIKAAAISCGGCDTIRKYASFTCPMPSGKG